VKVQPFKQLLEIRETNGLNFEDQIGVSYEWSGITHTNQNRTPYSSLLKFLSTSLFKVPHLSTNVSLSKVPHVDVDRIHMAKHRVLK